MGLTIKVNGIERTVDVDGDTPLLWVLRGVLGLTSTKFGRGTAAAEPAPCMSTPGIPTAFWRSAEPSHNVFVTESFIEERAVAARLSPIGGLSSTGRPAPRPSSTLPPKQASRTCARSRSPADP